MEYSKDTELVIRITEEVGELLQTLNKVYPLDERRQNITDNANKTFGNDLFKALERMYNHERA